MSQNKVPNKPEMRDLLALLKKDIFINFNCHAIATVTKFDSTKLTIEASMVYQKTYYPTDAILPPTIVNYPALVDCPVLILSGGTSGITFPIAPGDTALILFNDRDIDNWYSSGQVAPPNTNRMHAMSDGIAIVGLRSLLNPLIPAFDENHALLFNGLTQVGAGLTQVRIANAITTLATVLNGLIDLITAITTVETSTPFAASALNPASIAALNAYKLVIMGLLE